MDTIGLIGGTSWRSTLEYYRILNEETERLLGGHNSAPITMVSFNFAEVLSLLDTGTWESVCELSHRTADQLVAQGASIILICSLTGHKCSEHMQASGIPVLHIADSLSRAIHAETSPKNGSSVIRLGLLGTETTMHDQFLRDALRAHDIAVTTPRDHTQHEIHELIMNELTTGSITPSGFETIQRACDELIEAGVDGILFGCTELELIPTYPDVSVPIFPAARIHAVDAVRRAIASA